VATTLQGLSVFPASSLHVGFGFGAAAVPSAQNAFRECDAMIAIGTRFSEIADRQLRRQGAENLIHIDINPAVFNANYPAKVAIAGDAGAVLKQLMTELEAKLPRRPSQSAMREWIKNDKAAYRESWYRHDAADLVNPVRSSTSCAADAR